MRNQVSGRQLVDARCYECWLPHVSLHICGGTPYGIRPILELPQDCVAAEARYATDPTRRMAVIHMLGRPSRTDTADTVLSRDHRFQLCRYKAVLDESSWTSRPRTTYGALWLRPLSGNADINLYSPPF
jgi:hypothetical protein